MNRPIYATAAEQRTICGVDEGIHRLPADVSLDNSDCALLHRQHSMPDLAPGRRDDTFRCLAAMAAARLLSWLRPWRSNPCGNARGCPCARKLSLGGTVRPAH